MSAVSLRGSPRPLHFWSTGYQISRSPLSPSSLIIHSNNSQNLGKCYTYDYCFIINDTHSRTRQMRFMEQDVEGHAELPCYPSWSQGISPSWHIYVFNNQETPLGFNIQSFYWGFFTQAWLIKYWRHDWTQSPATSPPLRSGWPKVTTFWSHGWFFWWPACILKLFRTSLYPEAI